ncbi:MAG: type II toxin-antitoxin system death-on-curing family toxin [Planctomycetota bacterium]
MDRIAFLSVENVLRLHAGTIRREGGADGVRDYGLLQSAVAMPRQQVAGDYLHEDIPAMAAAYLYHVARNHPFRDGNKRTGALAAPVFLDVNGWDLTARPRELERVVICLAAGEMSKDALTGWMRNHTRRRT